MKINIAELERCSLGSSPAVLALIRLAKAAAEDLKCRGKAENYERWAIAASRSKIELLAALAAFDFGDANGN